MHKEHSAEHINTDQNLSFFLQNETSCIIGSFREIPDVSLFFMPR